MSGASRNWRRFNFFDRTNTPLPKNAQVDLVPEDRADVIASLATVILTNSDDHSSGGDPSDLSFVLLDEDGCSNVQALTFAGSDISPRVHCLNVNDRAVTASLSTSSSDVTGNNGVVNENSYKGFFEPILSRNSTGICDLSALNYENKFILVASVSSSGLLAVSLFQSSTFLSARESVVASAIPISPLCTVSADEGQERFSCVDIYAESGWVYVAAGTREGKVFLFNFHLNLVIQEPRVNDQQDVTGTNAPSRLATKMNLICAISPPGNTNTAIAKTYSVTTVNILHQNRSHIDRKLKQGNSIKQPIKLFVCYDNSRGDKNKPQEQTSSICCYEITPSNGSIISRSDLDTASVTKPALCDYDHRTGNLVVARDGDANGLLVYSSKDHRGAVAGMVDSQTSCMCCIPANVTSFESRQSNRSTGVFPIASSYALVASMDSKSNRDAVDVYDATNKLIAFHTLLSPGHRALRASAFNMPHFLRSSVSRQFIPSAVLLTSGGTIVSLIERSTSEKVGLLLQKNLFAAAISIAYTDPSFPTQKVANLYRQHAEFLYQKGDFEGAMDQYIHTIGSLEPSHIIFRYLDAPKIPLLVKYLEQYRSRQVDNEYKDDHVTELLKTCYMKLNDPIAVEKLAGENKLFESALAAVSACKSQSEALATLCSFEAEEAAKAMEIHGPMLVKSLPRETCGVVISLCDGTYSPNSLTAARSLVALSGEALESSLADRPKVCRFFPVEMFQKTFVEHPKLLRLILSHCRRAKCSLSPPLRRCHLELTLEEWSSAVNEDDKDLERSRAKEAMMALTDGHVNDIGIYEALVLCRLSGFSQGEVVLYEKLHNAPTLIERYASEGTERARRQMLAISQGDPDLVADVLGHFVSQSSNRLSHLARSSDCEPNYDDESEGSVDDILDDIREALDLAKAQDVLPAVRIARILSGEGTGQFSETKSNEESSKGVPLFVALDYIGSMLDESSKEIMRLKREIESYSTSCDEMQHEIDVLLQKPETNSKYDDASHLNIDIDDLYARLCESLENGPTKGDQKEAEQFWREIGQTEGSSRFSIIARYFGKGLIP